MGTAQLDRSQHAKRRQDISANRRNRRQDHRVDAKAPKPLEPLPPFFTIGIQEFYNTAKTLRKPLSGYLGGEIGTGYWIERLTNQWCETFGCEYAVPCNSATSGLLAACMAIGIKPGDTIWVPAYTMSATAACAKVLGAHLEYIDIETLRYAMNLKRLPSTSLPKAIIVTNLFGHPAYLAATRSWCDQNKIWMIEDNAQAPFAKEGTDYTGTIGHMGVFSLNVHKHIQAGEGGVVVTNDFGLSVGLRNAINHGELALFTFTVGRQETPRAGLNLRMSEPIAAIASAQLEKGRAIIAGRVALAEELTDMFGGIRWLVPPVQDKGCKHVYYLWAARVGGGRRDRLCEHLAALGMPIRCGYSPPLNRVFLSKTCCPEAERMEDEALICFEVCAYDPSAKQRKHMREIVRHVVGSLHDQ